MTRLARHGIVILWLSLLYLPAGFAQDSDKGNENSQNNEKFLQYDMNLDDFNYFERTEISKLVMPRMDQDSMEFQNTGKKRKQQNAYIENDYYYPSKPKDQWEIGINGGLMMISGDVKPRLFGGYKPPLPGFGAGVTIRKSFGYLFSLRAQYMFGITHGQNWEPSSINANHQALSGRFNTIDYTANSTNPKAFGIAFHNYEIRIQEASIAAVLTLGNVKFHRERNVFNLYTFFGGGFMAYESKIDQLDANGDIYDYRPAYDTWTRDGSKDNKKTILDVLYNQMAYDGVYESFAESHVNEEGLKIGNHQYVINPIANVGLGLGFHLSKRMTLNIEQRITWTNDDLIDGSRYEESGSLTRDFDTYAYTFVSLNFHLGKKGTEPLWWMNPMDYTYKKLGEMDPQRIIDDLLKDGDDDGVPNKLDRELETPKGCPVDPKGIALDSDKDGCLDCLDKEPFSPPGYPIDENCVAIIPPPDCCDDISSLKAGGSYDCSKIELPSVHFDTDKFYVKPEYFAHLHSIAEKMQMCPDLKVVAIGSADSRNDSKYNEQLSWNRVNKTIDYLTNKYGISRDRFVVKYLGEAEAGGETSEQEYLRNRKVNFRFSDDGETGPSNPPAPHPGLKAGSDK